MRIITTALSALALSIAAAPALSPAFATTTIAQEAEVLKEGTFDGFEGHRGQGTARIVRDGGRLFLEFEGFRTDRGPDLFVWLADDHVTSNEEGRDVGFTNIGRLESARASSQRYALPSGTDADDVGAIVIWCRAFGILFASAELS
ncbi:MAG: DM13 domain-containing protein [Pseudomonadota bacterium]